MKLCVHVMAACLLLGMPPLARVDGEAASDGKIDNSEDLDGDAGRVLSVARSATPFVSIIPVTDGNPDTDSNGYAGSNINSVAYAQDNLITVGNQQFIAYYRRHAADANHDRNNTVLIARRNIDASEWEVFPTTFSAGNIDDGHYIVSMGIDGAGVLHMAWGMHNHRLRYARSVTSVLGHAPIEMTANLGPAGMTGAETQVTYPHFLSLPNGDLLFLFRAGGSGNGNWFLNRYSKSAGEWTPVHTWSGGGRKPLFRGTGARPDNCFYPDRFTMDSNGVLHMSGVFRASHRSFQTNHRYVYLRSADEGATWQRTDGSPIDLPLVIDATFLDSGESHVAEIVKDIPQNHSLVNQAGLTTDSAGRPIIATWYAPDGAGVDVRNYFIFFHDGEGWHRRQVSDRSAVGGWLRRPIVMTDADDRILMIYYDGRSPGIQVVFSQPLALDPERLHWKRMHLTNEDLGGWEPTYDEQRWRRDGVLQMLYQKSGAGNPNRSSPVSVITWDARAYFQSFNN